MATEPLDIETLGSDLTVYAGRLVRLIRRNHAPSAGNRMLSVLEETGAQTITALAQFDNCSQPTMTGQVNQLVGQGWVRKGPNPHDARSSLVSLTDAGRAEIARVRRLSGALVADRMEQHPELTTEDLTTAVAVLRAVLTTEPERN